MVLARQVVLHASRAFAVPAAVARLIEHSNEGVVFAARFAGRWFLGGTPECLVRVADRRVSAMFDEVAAGYDRTRAAIWLGRTGAWGRAAARVAGARPGQRVLDVAAGTGSSAVPMYRAGDPHLLHRIRGGNAATLFPRLTPVTTRS